MLTITSCIHTKSLQTNVCQIYIFYLSVNFRSLNSFLLSTLRNNTIIDTRTFIVCPRLVYRNETNDDWRLVTLTRVDAMITEQIRKVLFDYKTNSISTGGVQSDTFWLCLINVSRKTTLTFESCIVEY